MQIDKNVPLPMNVRHKFKGKYPWGSLQVGDSFVHPGSRQAATVLMIYHANSKGTTYTSKQEDGGFRIWRVT